MSINPNVLLGVLQTPKCTLLDMDECVLSVSWLNVDWLTSGAKKKREQQEHHQEQKKCKTKEQKTPLRSKIVINKMHTKYNIEIDCSEYFGLFVTAPCKQCTFSTFL